MTAQNGPAMMTLAKQKEAPSLQPTPVKSVALVGYAASTRGLAKALGPEWERWGLNQLYVFEDPTGYARWFEIHDRDLCPEEFTPDYLAFLRAQRIPVMMAEAYPDIPAAVRLPRERLIDRFGRYFTSSLAWMLAVAIDEGYQRIRLYGVDMMGDSEYEIQRACCEHLISYARGIGREVWTPPQAALFRATHLYGLEPEPQVGAVDQPYLRAEIKDWGERLEQLMQQAQITLGQRQMCQKILALVQPQPVFAPLVARLEIEAAELRLRADQLLAQAAAAEGAKGAYERQLGLVAHWRKWGASPGPRLSAGIP